MIERIKIKYTLKPKCSLSHTIGRETQEKFALKEKQKKYKSKEVFCR